jgi:hypothetical protein
MPTPSQLSLWMAVTVGDNVFNVNKSWTGSKLT